MNRCHWVALVMLAAILGGGPAVATILDGVTVPGSQEPRVQDAPPIFRLPYEIMIDFDDQPQPPGFAETIALTDEYLDQGVVFSGPNPGDGGGILDEAGSFGVSGHSSPNFLAFNCFATFMDGHHPVCPERLDFPVLVTAVSALVGSNTNAGENLTLAAYDESGELVDSSTVTLSPVMQEITVEALAISYVIFGQEATCIWVLDDLGFNPGPVAAEQGTWSRIKCLYR